jgi:hypothetical protein
MMDKEFQQRIKELFYQKLQEKPTWGRNQVMSMYETSVNDAIIELLDKM